MKTLRLSTLILAFWIPLSSPSATEASPTWIDFRSETRTAFEDGHAAGLQKLLTLLEELDQAPTGWMDYWSAYLHYRSGLLAEAPADSVPPLQACIEHAGSAAAMDDPKEPTLRAEALALLGACHSSLAGTGPTAGMQHGPRAAMLRDESLLIAPDNPRVLTLAGVQDVWTPVQWGGSPERAERQLRHALEHFEQQTEQAPWQPRWGRSDAIGHLALALDRLDRSDEAQRVLDQARDEGLWNGWLDQIRKQLEPKTSG